MTSEDFWIIVKLTLQEYHVPQILFLVFCLVVLFLAFKAEGSNRDLR